MGAICPKGKHSKGRRDRRRAQSFTIVAPTLVPCPKCSTLMKSHHACRKCGTYNKRDILAISAEKQA